MMYGGHDTFENLPDLAWDSGNIIEIGLPPDCSGSRTDERFLLEITEPCPSFLISI